MEAASRTVNAPDTLTCGRVYVGRDWGTRSVHLAGRWIEIAGKRQAVPDCIKSHLHPHRVPGRLGHLRHPAGPRRSGGERHGDGEAGWPVVFQKARSQAPRSFGRVGDTRPSFPASFR